MSDRREYPCRVCGSLLHYHEDAHDMPGMGGAPTIAPLTDSELEHVVSCIRWAGDRLEYEEAARAEEAVRVLADLAAKSPRMEMAIDLALRLLCDVTPERLDVVRDVLRVARGKS